MKVVLVLLNLAAAGCASADMPQIVVDPDNPTQAELNAITDVCNAPHDLLQLDGSQVTIRPIVFEDFEANLEPMECVFEKIKESGITKFGFIGNEKAREMEE